MELNHILIYMVVFSYLLYSTVGVFIILINDMIEGHIDAQIFIIALTSIVFHGVVLKKLIEIIVTSSV